MEIGFLIPTYLLVIYTYGWWLYSRIIWVNAFTNYDLVFYLWLALTFIFHVGVIRTINSRYGYSKECFSVKNFYGQWLIYLLGFPLIMLDWQCMRNFSYFLARTCNKFWIILYFLKLGAIASVWTVLGYYLDKDNYKMILSANFVFGFTVLTFLNHPWIMKIWLLIIYFVPFIVYIIAKIIIYPFTFCLCCCFCCKKRSDDSDANDSRSNRSDVAHEGGGDESNKDSNFDDINNMDSARDFDNSKDRKKKTKSKSKSKSRSKGKKKQKLDKSKSIIENDIEKGEQSEKTEHLETNAPLEEQPSKIKKVKKSKKQQKEIKDKINEDKQKNEDNKDKVKKGDRDTRDLDSLNFFSRSWRCLKPRYCVKCDRMIKVHHPEFECSVGHWLHSKCAHVKWIGNNVCPICVKEPKFKPKEVTSQMHQIEIQVEEEIEDSEHVEGPMKPNQL